MADAPFARPFGVPDGLIAFGLYLLVLMLLLAPLQQQPWLWPTLLILAVVAMAANVLGVYDMMRLGAFCFYFLLTTALSPLLLWTIW